MDLAPPDVDFIQALTAQIVERIRRQRFDLIATYRLQLNRGFTFYDAAKIVPYLKDLGISHVYCSPYLRAQSGSTHGYDICDHTQFHPDLGGEPGFREFVAALRTAGLGQILDIVPNHMAASLENPWWFDVLENGPASPFSWHFDIDWQPIKQELSNKVLLPVLGQPYGEALENGQLQLIYRDGAFFIGYFDRQFPLGPKTTIPLLQKQLESLQEKYGESCPDVTELESIITALEHLPPQATRDPAAIRERHREKEVIKRRLNLLMVRSPPVREHVLRNVEDYRGDPARPDSWDLLHRLLDAQPYRLSHWRSAADEINYRRFFDVNELAAICMELPEVFHATHALLRPFLADGTITGLRIDHVDGLYDPEQYLWRLQWAYLADLGELCFHEHQRTLPKELGDDFEWRRIGPTVLCSLSQALGMRPPTSADLRAVFGTSSQQECLSFPSDVSGSISMDLRSSLFVLVEKILGPDEPLPKSWPVAGTSGYDFLNLVGGLFVFPAGLADIVRGYERFLDYDVNPHEIAYRSKLLILRVSMASELQMLAHRLNHISEQHRRSRDFTLNTLRLAIREVLACFPVYRVYPGRDGINDRDRRFVNLAVGRARRRSPELGPGVFEFLRSVLLLSHPDGLTPEQITEREVFTGKFQQVTSPVMAKGLEDTAFYVNVPLLSVNEVGNDPQRASTTIEAFHESNRQRNLHSPRAMLSTSTHDTKRSEDVRARLHVLTEIPRVWRDALNRFSRINKRFRRDVDGEQAPSWNDEYLFYQSLLGVWPLHPPTGENRLQLVDRLLQFMQKAIHEAKQRTSWNNPHEEYDAAVQNFVTQSLRDSPRNLFLKALQEFVAKIASAGQLNALSQLALKLLSPGVPDIYQGQELWDDSLVDPDNRRSVDYSLRSQLLAEIRSWDELPDNQRRTRVVALGKDWSDSRLKLLVTRRLLHLRRDLSKLFEQGEYVPLTVTGPQNQHAVAFGWRHCIDLPLDLVALFPRWAFALLADRPAEGAGVLWRANAWAETELSLPEGTNDDYQNVFTERLHHPHAAKLSVLNLIDEFPLAVLLRERCSAMGYGES